MSMQNKKRKTYWIAVIVVSMVIIESVLHGVAFIANYCFEKKQGVRSRKYLLSPYKAKQWVKDFYRELEALRIHYEQFLEWDRAPFQGKYITVDSFGVRKTWNPVHDQQASLKTVYLFGGSTIWDHGARDEYAIPSFVSKKLNDNDNSDGYMVSNYGERGYIFCRRYCT